MKLRFSYAFVLIYAVVCEISVPNASMSRQPPVLQGEETTPANSSSNATKGSSEVLSDKATHVDKFIVESSETEIGRLVCTTSKLCASTDLENVTQNTTELSTSTTRAVSSLNSTHDRRHFGRPPQPAIIPTPSPSVSESEVIPLLRQQNVTSQNSSMKVNSSCSAEPTQRLCGCSSVCTQLNNCCHDSDYVNADQNSNTNHTQYSCYENLGAKLVLSSPSRLVDKCLPSWIDDSVRQRCEAPNTSDFESYLPCFSPETDLVYKNVHCLRCNGLVNFTPWELSFISKIPLNYPEINTFPKLHAVHGYSGSSHFYFSVSQPFHQEPIHCLPSGVQSCNGEFDNNATVSKLCQAYYDPIFVDNVSYRNVDCFRCSTNKSSGNIVNVPRKGLTTEFGLILKFSNPLQRKGTKCSGKTCLPTINRIRGFAENFPLSVLAVNLGNTPLNLSTTKDIEVYWKRQYQIKISSRLVGFNATVRYRFEGDFIMIVGIPEEISIEQVPLIQKTIRSISLQVNYRNTVIVSCHVTGFGSEPILPTTSYPELKRGINIVNSINAAERSFTALSTIVLCLTFNILWFN